MYLYFTFTVISLFFFCSNTSCIYCQLRHAITSKFYTTDLQKVITGKDGRLLKYFFNLKNLFLMLVCYHLYFQHAYLHLSYFSLLSILLLLFYYLINESHIMMKYNAADKILHYRNRWSNP